MPKNKFSILLVLIFVLAAILRLWGINFGLPYQFHQDEPIVINHAFAYGSGDLNPHFFIIPPLTSYIVFVAYGVYYLVLSLFFGLKSTEQFAISFLKDPAPFYLISRLIVGFVPSLISAWLTYKIAAKYFSKRAAIYSFLVMSISFLNVVNAHYAYTDNLLVLFILCAYLFILSILDKPALRNYILAGIFSGLAIATKYNAALIIAPFILSHFMVSSKGIDKAKIYNVFIALSFIVLTFAICNPYSVLDWRFFLSSVTGKIRHGYIGWSHHIAYSLFEGLGIYTTILGIVGLAILLKKNFKSGILLLSFPVLFYLHLVFASQPFSRYVLSLIPFLSIGLGFILYDYFYLNLKSKITKVIFVIASLLIIFPTVAKSIKADMLFSAKDTRIDALLWIKQNLPVNSKIAFDDTSFRVPLKQTIEQLKSKEAILTRQEGLEKLKKQKLSLQEKALIGEKTYEIYYLGTGQEDAGQFLGLWPFIRNNIEELKKYKIEYIIFNNMNASEGMREFHQKITNLFPVVANFIPYKDKDFRLSYDDIETTCLTLKSKELFSRIKPGPHIIIYKIR